MHFLAIATVEISLKMIFFSHLCMQITHSLEDQLTLDMSLPYSVHNLSVQAPIRSLTVIIIYNGDIGNHWV